MLTEDEVRSKADKILNFKSDKDHVAGIGQLTTFKKISKSINNDPYWASDDINVLSMKDEYDNLNGSTGLFFCACIQRAGQSFGYTDKWTVNKMKGTSIFLPVTPSGQPDFDYMTKYIEMIQISAKCSLQSYHKVDKLDK